MEMNSYWSLHYAFAWVRVEKMPAASNRGVYTGEVQPAHQGVTPHDEAGSATGRRIDTMPQPTPPTSHQDLLERPLFAHLATVRPDGAPQSGLMWFAWDGERAPVLTHPDPPETPQSGP